MNDIALVKRCQQGDKSAFEDLLQRHYDTIYRFAYRWCGDRHNAQDITQQACLKLAGAISRFEFRSSFTSWLYRLVINCARDYYKSPNQYSGQQAELNENAMYAEDRSAQRLYAQQILEHIDTLQEDLRDTLILVYGTGMTHGQAAESLNIKESTVSWRVHEARKALKQTFSSSRMAMPSADTVRGPA